MRNRLLPYGSTNSSALVAKVGVQKIADASLMIYGSDSNAPLIAKEGQPKAPHPVAGHGQKRVVRLNARK